MRTVLDEAHTWFLEAIIYDGERELRATVVEGFKGEQPVDVHFGDNVINDCYPLKPSGKSKKLSVLFSRPITWQVTEESWTVLDKSEKRDEGRFLQKVEQSAFLKFVNEQIGWFAEVVGPAYHYRLCTENEIIDVISHKTPIIEPAPPES